MNQFDLDVLLLYKIWMHENCRCGPSLHKKSRAIPNLFNIGKAQVREYAQTNALKCWGFPDFFLSQQHT